MSLGVLMIAHSKGPPTEGAEERQGLVRRVAVSVTLEKSPRLRAFFLHVCKCALENRSDEATEQQIGIYVYGRQPSYNPNEDNIVRSQARVLRMKLEHHFVNEGKDEPVIITIPKGQYLPIFEARFKEPQIQPRVLPPPPESKPRRSVTVAAGVAVLFGLVIALLGYLSFESRRSPSPSALVPHCHSFPGNTERGRTAGERPAGRSSLRRRRDPDRQQVTPEPLMSMFGGIVGKCNRY